MNFWTPLLICTLFIQSNIFAADKIYILGKKNEELTFSSNRDTIIDLSQFSENYVTLSSILTTISGISVSKAYGLLDDQNLSIRGFSSSQIKILVDGVPLSSESKGANAVFDIPLSNIEQIIITKGPSSSLYGNATMGGAINIITKKELNDHRVKISYGSFETRLYEFDSFINRENIKINLTTFYNSTSGKFEVKTNSKEDDKIYIKNNQQKSSGIKTNIQLYNLLTSITFNENLRGIPGTFNNPTLEITEYKNNISLLTRLTDIKIQDNLSLKLQYSFQNQYNQYNDTKGEQNSFPQDSKTNNLSHDYKSQIVSDYENFKVTLDFSLNKEYYKNNHMNVNRNITNSSTFIQYQLNEYWNTNISYTHTNSDIAEDHESRGINIKGNWFKNRLSLMVNHSNGFRYPRFDELYLQQGFTVGNKDLKSELTRGYEIELYAYFFNTSTKFTYFDYKTKDLIEYLLISGFQYKPFNYARTKTRGVELELNYQIDEKFDFNWVHSTQEIKDDDPKSYYYGKFIPNKPWSFGQSKIKYGIFQHLIIDSSFTYSIGRFVNRANTKKLPHNKIVNFGLLNKLSEKTSLKFDILNILNQYNIDVRDFPLPGRAYYITLQKLF